MSQTIQIRDNGTLAVIVDGICNFSGTPKELAPLEDGVAIEELIKTFGDIRDKLIEAKAQQKK